MTTFEQYLSEAPAPWRRFELKAPHSRRLERGSIQIPNIYSQKTYPEWVKYNRHLWIGQPTPTEDDWKWLMDIPNKDVPLLDALKNHDGEDLDLVEMPDGIVLKGNLNLDIGFAWDRYPWLERLVKIEGNLDLYCCDSLTDMRGFKNLNTVNGNVSIYSCRNLKSLHGLENLTSVNIFHIEHCENLKKFDVLDHPWVNIRRVQFQRMNNAVLEITAISEKLRDRNIKVWRT